MKILAVGVARSGTSFLGELFRQNPDIPYLYEPFWGRTFFVERQWSWLTERDLEPDGRKLLQEVFAGQFDELLRTQSAAQRGQRFSSRREELEAELYRHRRSLGDDLAIKEIRLNMHLRWALDVIGPELRIVHLVRDPRGVVGSFLFSTTGSPAGLRGFLTRPWAAWRATRVPPDSLYREWTGWFDTQPIRRFSSALARYEPYFDRGAAHTKIAARWAVFTGQALADAPELPRQQYLRVRYEDLCERPLDEARRIYAFLGRPLPKPVEQWLVGNTQQGDRGDRYGTSRKSLEMIDAWQTQLTTGQCRDVESLCRPMMDELGYRDA